MEVKYSVIIPVYNAEKTIERCLQSLFSQKRKDVEIIVINDGSTDKSGEIISEYAAYHENLIWISHENKGVSAARNLGIETASGVYLLFVDSDDFVSKDYFYVLDQLGELEDSDLLMFASNTVGGRNTDEAKIYSQLEKMDKRMEKMELLLSSRKIMPPWNKRFKKEIILEHKIRFINHLQTGEDFNFCLEYMINCHTIRVKYQQIYNVDVSDQASLSRKYREHLDIQLEKVFRNAAGLIKTSCLETNEKDHLLRIVDYLFVKNVFTCIAEEFKKEKPNYRKKKREIVEIYKKFFTPLCRRGEYYNFVHRTLRFLIKNRYVFPVYGITRLAKEKQFTKYIEE